MLTIRLIQTAFLAVLLSSSAFACSGKSHSDDSARSKSIDFTKPDFNGALKQVHTAMILWKTGLLETITPASVGNHKSWRITHYSQDPTESKTNDYDLYDLDQTTLAPLRSVRNTEEYHLDLVFADHGVAFHKTTDRGTTTEEIPLTTRVEAEGPGLTLFVACLPLTTGYKVQYAIVDRWDGQGSTRVKNMTLVVTKRITKRTFLGTREVYELVISPGDGSFRIRETVLARGLHFPLSVEYTRDGKTYPPSEVIAIVDNTF